MLSRIQFSSRLVTFGGTTPQRRLLLFAGGGLALMLLLSLQSALEQAAGPSIPAASTPPAGTVGELPDYSAFASAPPTESAWWLIGFGLVLKLLVVLLLIYAVLWLLRRYYRRLPHTIGQADALRLLQTISLGQQQQIHLVEVGDRVLVVGGTPQQITLLTEITERAAVSELRLRTGQPAAAESGSAFADYLAASLQTRPVAATRSATPSTSPQTTATAQETAPTPETPERADVPTSGAAAPGPQSTLLAANQRSPAEVQRALRDSQAAIQRQIAKLRRAADHHS